MTTRHSMVLGLAAACTLAASALGACGKSSREERETAPSKPTTPTATPASSGAAPAPPPAAPPSPAPPAAAPTHVAYSLIDNRLSAHLARGGGLLVPAGSAGFAKYVRFGNVMNGGASRGWKLRQTRDDVKVARAIAATASVDVPLTAEQAARAHVRARVHAGKAGPLGVRANGHAPVKASLPAGWSTVDLALPAGQLVAGENALELNAPSPGLEIAWLELGAATPVGDDGQVGFYDAGRAALRVPAGGAMSWYVMIPDGARLAVDVADRACQIGARATAEDGATATATLTGAGAELELAPLAGKATRIELAASACPEAAITRAALVVPGPAPVVTRGAPPRHVLLVIMDSLRADRIRAFAPDARPATPAWDQLAATSTLFGADYVQGNESLVSHASIWSSAYLAKHRTAQSPAQLASKWTTIDEVARHAGLYTAGASANGYIRPARGFGQAWDRFANHLERGLGLHGADVIADGLSFVEKKKDQPWFLYLGLIDTHVTWRGKQPWLATYDGHYRGRFATEFGDDGPGGMPTGLSDKEKAHVRALYDSNVSYQDELLGKLVATLEQWGVWDDTMLIVTADHGDEQWEDGRIGHGGSERETLLHVPLLIHYPPMFPAGKVTAGTESIDIVPTVADVLGVAADPEWQGTSLVPLAAGAAAYPLLSTSSKYENGHAGRIGRWKIVLAGINPPRLYDLAADPGEHKDRWGAPDAQIAARLLLDPMWILRQWNVEWSQASWGNAADVSPGFAAAMGE